MSHDTHTSVHSPQASALADPDRMFTAAQVADLMATAGRWGREAVEDEPSELSWRAGFEAGYRERVDEENRGHPASPVFTFGEWLATAEVQAYRERIAADRTQRYAGGPVEVWEATRPDHVPPRDVSVRVVRSGAGWVWRDA